MIRVFTNICFIQIQLDVQYSFFLKSFFALHVSDVTCIHRQERNYSVQAWVLYRWKTEVLVSSGVEVYFMLILCESHCEQSGQMLVRYQLGWLL
jgi:hypothetical protein